MKIYRIDEKSVVKYSIPTSWEDEYGSSHSHYVLQDKAPFLRDYGLFVAEESKGSLEPSFRLTPTLKLAKGYQQADFKSIVNAECVGNFYQKDLFEGGGATIECQIKPCELNLFHISQIPILGSFYFVYLPDKGTFWNYWDKKADRFVGEELYMVLNYGKWGELFVLNVDTRKVVELKKGEIEDVFVIPGPDVQFVVEES